MGQSFDYDPTKKDPSGKWLWLAIGLILIIVVLVILLK